MRQLLKISQQTFWQVLGKVVTSLSTFIILGLVTRNYGPEGTGVFTLSLTYLAIFYLLADFGFNAHVLRKFSITRLLRLRSVQVRSGRVFNFQFSNGWRRLLGVRILWSILLVILAVGLLPFLSIATADFNKAVLFGSLAIIGSSIFTTCNLIFQSRLRYDLSVLASSLGTMVSLAVFVLLVIFKLSIPWLLVAHLIGWLAIASLALFLIRKFFRQISPVFDFQYTKDLFKESWPVAATLALNVVYFRADSFMVAYFKSVSDTGIYNVAYSVFQSALVLPTFIMNAYYPLMLKSLDKFKLIAFGLVGLSVVGTFFTIVFAPFIINILTGGGFSGSTTSLQILSLGFPAYFLSALLMWLLILRGQYKAMFLLYMSGLIFNLAFNLLYIPQYSYFAASWITVISEYFILFLQIVVLCWKPERDSSSLVAPQADKMR